MAWLYVRFGSVPQARGLLYGVKPVIIAVVVQAIWALGRAALKGRLLMAVGAASLFASFLGVNELATLLAAGVMTTLIRALLRARESSPPVGAIFGSAGGLQAAAANGAIAFSPTKLFLVFLKIGSILFGSGYVLLAFLRADLVERLQWLTEKQLIDAVAVGQLTPGPVSSTATFIGYVVGGGSGAALATTGIFLPSFFFVAISGAIIPRLRRSEVARAFLDGVNVASLMLMITVTWELGRASLVDPLTFVLAALSALLLFRYKVNSAWLVLGGALAGIVFNRFFPIG
jgi:chromate transporter